VQGAGLQAAGTLLAAQVTYMQSIVQTTAQTTYQGLSPDSFSGLALGDTVSVNGWVFPQNGILDPAVGPPMVVAQTVSLHPGGMF
jgi:hypothetical protein